MRLKFILLVLSLACQAAVADLASTGQAPQDASDDLQSGAKQQALSDGFGGSSATMQLRRRAPATGNGHASWLDRASP